MVPLWTPVALGLNAASKPQLAPAASGTEVKHASFCAEKTVPLPTGREINFMGVAPSLLRVRWCVAVKDIGTLPKLKDDSLSAGGAAKPVFVNRIRHKNNPEVRRLMRRADRSLNNQRSWHIRIPVVRKI
jgi:hypothetical protein